MQTKVLEILNVNFDVVKFHNIFCTRQIFEKVHSCFIFVKTSSKSAERNYSILMKSVKLLKMFTVTFISVYPTIDNIFSYKL